MAWAVLIVLAAAFTLMAAINHPVTLLDRLRSLIFLSYPFIYIAWEHACFMLAPALKMLGLHMRAVRGNESLHSAVRLERATPVFFETSDLPVHENPGIVAQNMISILDEYDAAMGISQRSQADRKSAREAATFGRLFTASGWPVALDPPVPGVNGFEHWTWTDGALYNRVPPTRGFIRRPRIDGIGKPPTAREVYGYTLEMIQHIDADGCLLRLCCEMEAEPMRYRRYQLRMTRFLLHLRRIGGASSTVMRRYEAAIEKGRYQFRGNSSRCAALFKECSRDTEKTTDRVLRRRP